jgi:DNA-binding FadR family transcriptional regulator
MSPKKPATISDSLLAGVLKGDYGSDRPLPREVDLADTYMVSRGTVRAAVQALEDRGIVSVVHGRAGAEVRPSVEWSLFDVSLLGTLLDSPMRRGLLREGNECLRLVAGEAAALAAERATKADVAELADRLDRVRVAVGQTHTGPRPTPELEFVRCVCDTARNRFLARATMPLEVGLAASERRTTRRTVDDLERVFKAIEAGDGAEARAAMHARLDRRA